MTPQKAMFLDINGDEVYPTLTDWCAGCGHMLVDHNADECGIPDCTPAHEFVARPAYPKRDSE